MYITRTITIVLGMLLVAPLPTMAATFEVSGWVPYWRQDKGIADLRPNLDRVSEINPFVYTIKSDGTLLDNGALQQEPWKSLIVEAKAKKIRIVPTIMTSNGELVHELLSNPKKRVAHLNNIQQMVRSNGFDGVDIDYEAKLAKTKPHFATFLKELAKMFPDKMVMCTIESRTPLEDRFTDIPVDIEYANDFKAINKYCDRVRIMAYDQQSIDITLNKKHEKEVYIPLADIEWVEKVMRVAMKDISPKKLMLGIPTYGHEYAVTAYADGFTYKKQWAFNPGYAVPLAQSLGITPTRTSGGELMFTYVPTTTPSGAPFSSQLSNGANVAAAAAALAASNNSNHTFNVLWWSDAQAIAQKVALAKKLGIRGVSVFKWDGGQDPGMWATLQMVK